MQNYFLLVACLVLSVHVPGQDRSERRVAARVAEQRAHASFTPFTPFTPTEAPARRDALVGPVVEAAAFMTPSRTALSGLLALPPDQLTLEIPTGDGSVALDLVRAEIHSSGFSLVTASTGAPVELVSGAHYRGTIAGDPNTLAAISIFADEVMGFVSDANGNHVLGKLEGDTDDHIYYNDRDLIDPPVFACHTTDEGEVRVERPAGGQDLARTARCVDLYWEVDHDIFLNKGGITNTTNYITGLFNQHAALFDNDGISVVLSELFIWDVPSPYSGNTTTVLLGQFQSYRNSFNGDVGDLLGYGGNGGLAVLDGLCAGNVDSRMCYSAIEPSYSDVPVHSFSVNVVTHEEGHVLGSPHTHACVWNGTNTAIDGCGPSEGYPYEGTCSGAPIPADGGTIMSYCHLTSVGVNFINGFGPQPTALLVDNVNNAPCVNACGSAGCAMPTGISSDPMANTATVSWTAVSGATSYNLQWRPTTTFEWMTVAGITSTSHILNGLSPGATYVFRVNAECAGGSSAYSANAAFTTPCTLGTACDDEDPYTENDIILADCLCAGTPLPGFYYAIQKVVARDRRPWGSFGRSVAIDGDYAIVGSKGDDLDAEGNDPIPAAGAAYIFIRSGNYWALQQKIVASQRYYDAQFGLSVAISGDRAIVGSIVEEHDADEANALPGAGAAYVFVRIGDTWLQQQKIVASDRAEGDWFGETVAISGNYAIVGASDEDEDATGGNSLTDAGSAYIFVQNGNTWSEQQKVVASDRDAFDDFGCSVAIDGDHAIVGATNAAASQGTGARGSAYIFTRSGSTWTQQQKIFASDHGAYDSFGSAVAINGERVLVGAPEEDHDVLGGSFMGSAGSAYFFVRSGNTWAERQKIVADDRAADDRFGQSVAISEGNAIVGAYREDGDVPGSMNLGSAYIFKLTGNAWLQQQKIQASDRAHNDSFGYSVAISGHNMLVGAFQEDEDVFGTNTISGAGSAYFFTDSAYADISTGLALTHTTTDLLVYPVPTSDVLNVLLPDTRAYRADVIGLDGRSVLALGTVYARTPVNVSALASGVYLLRITSLANEIRFVRFVKE